MAREVVTGYCWPQSVGAGEQVGLHMSSSGGAAGARRGGAGRRATDVVFSSGVATDEHETPKDAASKGCGWPVALTLDVDPTWRSGYYEVVMEIDVGEKVRRDYAFFVVRPTPGAHRARAGDQYVARLQRLRRTEPVHRRHPRCHAAADGGGLPLQAAGQGPSRDGDGRARSAERRARRLRPRSTICRATPGRRVGPTGSCRSSSGPSAKGSRSVCARTPISKNTPRCWTARACICRSATTSTGPWGMRDTVEAFIARGGNAAFFSGNTSLWQVRIEGDDHDVMVGYKGFFKNDPLMETDREPEVTTFWSDVVVGRPENHMTGVSRSPAAAITASVAT